jgi:hypothetical protein
VINKRWLLVVKKAQGLMASKKQFPHQWEIKHDGRSLGWSTSDAVKKPHISIYNLEKMETLPYRAKMSSNFHGITSLPYQFPIIRFLIRQVGREYDEVYSELLARIPKKYHSTIQIEKLIFNKAQKQINKLTTFVTTMHRL